MEQWRRFFNPYKTFYGLIIINSKMLKYYAAYTIYSVVLNGRFWGSEWHLNLCKNEKSDGIDTLLIDQHGCNILRAKRHSWNIDKVSTEYFYPYFCHVHLLCNNGLHSTEYSFECCTNISLNGFIYSSKEWRIWHNILMGMIDGSRWSTLIERMLIMLMKSGHNLEHSTTYNCK